MACCWRRVFTSNDSAPRSTNCILPKRTEMIRRLFLVAWLMAGAAMPALAFQQPAAQSEYVPVKDLPPVDQLPAAPLLVDAYSFIWLAAMFYLLTIWRRIGKVEAGLGALEDGRRQQ